jgi:Spy/CpxP family protein refolding chaperone
MLSRKAVFASPRRTTAIVLAAALALTAVAPSVASAASAGKGVGVTTGGMTDISARRRGFSPGAAGAAAVAGVVGLGIAAAAAANSRAYYDDGYGYYGGGPVYVAPAPGPYYYGGYGGYGGYGSGVPADQHGHPLASW